MPTIREIMQEERSRENGWVGMFLEGKFWKAYEQSAYVLSRLYNFKPTKRYVKAVNEDVISIGFPVEQLGKYLSGAIVEIEKKRCSAKLQYSVDGFEDWKAGTRVKEPKPKNPVELLVPEEWKPKTQVMKEENLPVFKLVYDLLMRIVHESSSMGKDFRYTLGEDLKKLLVRVEVCIYHANEKRDVNEKLSYIDEALEKMLEVKLYVRILHDSKQISLKKYALLCEQMVQIEINLKSWKQYYSLKK